MKGNELDTERIEGFILDKLSPQQKLQFTSLVNKDPLLQNELNVQKEIITAIQTQRKNELKNRLSKIEVTTNSYTRYAKYAAAFLLISGSVSGFYLWNSSADEKLEIAQTTSAVNSVPAAKAQDSELTKPLERNIPVEADKVQLINPESKASPAPVKVEKERKGNKTRAVQPISNKLPDFSDSLFDDNGFDKSIALPQSNIDKDARFKPSKSTEVEIVEHTGDLKYKYYNNKLFLYGHFASSPYELLELNAHTGRTLFLYFENSYYELSANTFEITSLNKLKDNKILTQLEKLRVK